MNPEASSNNGHGRRAAIVCVANQKGGVGKTTTAVSLAAELSELGAEVLLADLDPQGNASTGLGIRVQEGDISTYGVLVEGAAIADAVRATELPRLHLLPSSLDLAGAEVELVPAFSRELRLQRAFEPVIGDYDVILIDCPPSLGLLTINALVAADQVLVPIQCEYYALEGLSQLMQTVQLVGDNLNEDLELGGVVLTMYDARTNLAQQVVDEIRDYFGDRAYATVIPRTVRLSEAPSFGQPITLFDPQSRGGRAYRCLAGEVAERLQLAGSVATGSAPETAGPESVGRDHAVTDAASQGNGQDGAFHHVVPKGDDGLAGAVSDGVSEGGGGPDRVGHDGVPEGEGREPVVHEDEADHSNVRNDEEVRP
jgi:chromosome partitioning protein